MEKTIMTEKYLTHKELMQYVKMGKDSTYKLGRDAKAVMQYGRRLLYDREKIDKYLNTLVVD